MEFLPDVLLASMGLIAAILTFLLPNTLKEPFPSMLIFSTSYREFTSDSDEYSINEGIE